MTTIEAIEAVEKMDEWDRLRLWWHWMIDRYTDNASYAPSVRVKNNVTLVEFFGPTRYPTVNGPRWTAATEYFKSISVKP